ncbi:MAG: Stp1/IreP family PP2C-type Ser/Thr phosphatase [Chloroflexaceae bacterium]|nr:Stp1/IreP family PP2C-type Ser/Thr phosphatase [Chloroflexaceae bacterium]NJL33674.1 Stp1/IreP family PP2C-type Ser/Thr phosphatase [Chloroflexaceae bacterium]NJO07358.1 Stp1/IreP family PP2C-type Ser/Thr phosphatase [Chloroflexaceae bacterium]
MSGPYEEPSDTDTSKLDDEPSVTLHRSRQGLAAAVLRDIGRVRQSNQDSAFAMVTSLPREQRDLALGLFVIADGMGGHDSGDVASRLAIRTVLAEIVTELLLPAMDDDMSAVLQPLMVSAVQEANRVIWEYAQDNHSDMGTTCTAALLIGNAVYIAHVGDSRAYLLEPGGLNQLTNDHSTVGRLIQLGQLEPWQAREHPNRNQLYRAVGQQPHVAVDFVYQTINNATHLLLCSDGLWGMLSEEQIQQALLHSPWPQDVCDELIALANLAGGEDNISAVVVTLPIVERTR